MARQEFKVGQHIMWRWYGDHWEERVVVTPVGHKTGYSYTARVVPGAPAKGERAYVEIEPVEKARNYSYTTWTVNARNRILSLEDYVPIGKAAAQAEADVAERKRLVDQAYAARYRQHATTLYDMARRPYGTSGPQNEETWEPAMARYLEKHFTLKG